MHFLLICVKNGIWTNERSALNEQRIYCKCTHAARWHAVGFGWFDVCKYIPDFLIAQNLLRAQFTEAFSLLNNERTPVSLGHLVPMLTRLNRFYNVAENPADFGTMVRLCHTQCGFILFGQTNMCQKGTLALANVMNAQDLLTDVLQKSLTCFIRKILDQLKYVSEHFRSD
jgi:hypothetical protein